jgi:hypothetical protein
MEATVTIDKMVISEKYAFFIYIVFLKTEIKACCLEGC